MPCGIAGSPPSGGNPSGLKTVCFGRETIEYYDETDSTNSGPGARPMTGRLSERSSSPKPRSGQGAAGKNLVFRTALRDLRVRHFTSPAQPHEAPQLTLLAAIAMTETLLERASSLAIKWPNDILVEGKKIAVF